VSEARQGGPAFIFVFDTAGVIEAARVMDSGIRESGGVEENRVDMSRWLEKGVRPCEVLEVKEQVVGNGVACSNNGFIGVLRRFK
jgi:hypothetical protein